MSNARQNARPEPGSWEAAMEVVPKKRNARANARTRGKVWERQVAKDLGTKRTGPTGMDDSDILHDTLGVECKAYKRIAFRDKDWKQTTDNAKGRIPILAVKELNTGRRIVFMEYDYFLTLHKEN